MIRAALLSAACLAAITPAMALDCRSEGAALVRLEADLPDPQTLPHDRQITCISLEINMDFVRRLAALAQACPATPPAGRLAHHQTRTADYATAFQQKRCKPSMFR